MSITEQVKLFDKSNQFKVLKESYKQVQFSWQHKPDLKKIDVKKIKNIIVTGLGGSAIGGDLLSNFLKNELALPYAVNRNYELPLYVDENSLIIASSYSGNTEETISALEQAITKKAQIICITTGGKVESICKTNDIPYSMLPDGFQPRYALWGNFFALLKIIETLQLVPSQDAVVNYIIGLLQSRGEDYSKENNYALEIAEKLNGYIPVIYSVADVTSAVGTRFKGQINENSKLHAFYNHFPEMNHNEIIGWETVNGKQFKCKPVFFYDEIYNDRIKLRFKIVSGLLEKSGIEIITLKSNEKEFKSRLIDLIILGDYISYYLAVIRGFDPTTISNINYLKKELS